MNSVSTAIALILFIWSCNLFASQAYKNEAEMKRDIDALSVAVQKASKNNGARTISFDDIINSVSPLLRPILSLVGFEEIVIDSNINHYEYYDEAREQFKGKGKFPSEDKLLKTAIDVYPYLLTSIGLDKFGYNPEAHFGLRIETPEIPLVNRKVVGANYKTGFTKPFIPPRRWSADGRIGVVAETSDGPLRVRLQRPEQLKTTFLDSLRGAQTMDLEMMDIDWEEWGLFDKSGKALAKRAQFVNICDPLPKYSTSKRNPYACGAGGQDDCYDMTLVGGAVQDNDSQTVGALEMIHWASPDY